MNSWNKTKGGFVAKLCLWPISVMRYLTKLVKTEAKTQTTQLVSQPQSNSPQSASTAGLALKNKPDNSGLTESLLIPEPTRSLVWTTNESTSKIEQAGSMNLVVTISDEGVDINEKENGFFAEPSLIWTRLPVQSNTELETRAMYWPAYSRLNPETRYQYLRWLQDITQPTNLSYVFLYFYGLERHLLVGDYDGAVEEILRLVKHHTQDSFRRYAASALTVASIAKNRTDIIDRAPFLLQEEIDATMALRVLKGTSMTPDDIISIASRVGFTNKRYIKLHPELFKKELQRLIHEFESKYGKLLSVFKLEEFSLTKVSVFANLSIPEKVSTIKVPQILDNKRFQEGIKSLLSQAHERVKKRLANHS